MSDPYRDENESLCAENARLRTQLAARRRARIGPAFLILGSDVIVLGLLRPWLNGGSDLKFWGAIAIVIGIALAAVLSAVGFGTGPLSGAVDKRQREKDHGWSIR